MILVADLVFHPGSMAAWVVVGMLVAWLVSLVMEAPTYGMIGDVLLGGAGGFIGGLVFGGVVTGQPNFWVSLLIAFLAASVLIAVARAIAAARAA